MSLSCLIRERQNTPLGEIINSLQKIKLNTINSPLTIFSCFCILIFNNQHLFEYLYCCNLNLFIYLLERESCTNTPCPPSSGEGPLGGAMPHWPVFSREHSKGSRTGKLPKGVEAPSVWLLLFYKYYFPHQTTHTNKLES